MSNYYTYGDSYGGVQSAQLAQDQARDSRFFQSLQANRAAQAQQMQMQAQQDANAKAAEQMDYERQKLEESTLHDLANREESKRQFEENLKWHTGNLGLERDKFNFQKDQPTAADINAQAQQDALRAKLFEQHNQEYQFSKNLADHMNRLMELQQQDTQAAQDPKLAELKKQAAGHSFVPDVLPPWLGGVDKTAAKQLEDLQKAQALEAQKRANERRALSSLDPSLEYFSGGDAKAKPGNVADLIIQDPKTGRFMPAVPPPEPFDFSKMAPLSTRPGLPAATGPAVAPSPAMLPSPPVGARPGAPASRLTMATATPELRARAKFVQSLLDSGMSYSDAIETARSVKLN